MTDIPQKIYVNIYRPFAGSCGAAYATRALADQFAAHSRLACIEVDTAQARLAEIMIKDDAQ